MDLLEKFKSTIKKYSMLNKGDTILVALSAGPDSIALLDLLQRLRADFSLNLIVAHYHHQLRGRPADLDEKLARETARKYHLEFLAGAAAPGWHKKIRGSMEETARKMRYDFLLSSADKIKADRIAVGHNANDLAESFFINLLRGSGLLGLAGMPPRREKIIRPLIETSRDEIMDYLHDRRLPFRIDKSNLNKKILRNRIRAELIPMLKTYNPKIVEALVRTGEILREDELFMESKSREAFAKLARKSETRVSFSTTQFSAQPKAVRRRMVRLAIGHLKKDLRRIGAEHLFELERMIDSRVAGFELDLPAGIRIRRSYDQLFLENAFASKTSGFDPVLIDPPLTKTIFISPRLEIEIAFQPAELRSFKQEQMKRKKRESIFESGEDRVFCSLDGFSGRLMLRPPRSGDRLQPLGMKGRRKLKDIFTDLEIPREQRAFYPVLASEKELLWVPGYGISEKVKVSPGSRKIFLLRIGLAEPGLPLN
jgi:tRNA(Ile)-lysidine synthase